jgi:hypothetical protein
LNPSDFVRVLEEREEIGYYPEWDVRLHRIHPFSDHFDRDHYSYYDGQNFGGSMRGYSVEDLAQYGNRWR